MRLSIVAGHVVSSSRMKLKCSFVSSRKFLLFLKCLLRPFMRNVFAYEQSLEKAFSIINFAKSGFCSLCRELRKVVFPHPVGPTIISNFFLLNIFVKLLMKSIRGAPCGTRNIYLDVCLGPSCCFTWRDWRQMGASSWE